MDISSWTVSNRGNHPFPPSSSHNSIHHPSNAPDKLKKQRFEINQNMLCYGLSSSRCGSVRCDDITELQTVAVTGTDGWHVNRQMIYSQYVYTPLIHSQDIPILLSEYRSPQFTVANSKEIPRHWLRDWLAFALDKVSTRLNNFTRANNILIFMRNTCALLEWIGFVRRWRVAYEDDVDADDDEEDEI